MNTNTEQAAGEIKRLALREVELTRQKVAKEAELAAAEQLAGSAYVDGDPGDLDHLLKLQTELRMIGVAMTACRERRLAAVKAVREARASELEERVEGLRQESQTIISKVQKLTELLEVEVAVTVAVPGRFSKAQNLGLQIQGLEEKIFDLQHAELPAAGTVDLDGIISADEAALAVLSSESVCPSAESVIAWFSECQTAASQPFGDHQRRVYLVWQSGEIDRDQSYIQVGDFMQSGETSAYSGRPVIDVRTGMFRAGKRTPVFIGAAAEPQVRQERHGLTYLQYAGYESKPERRPQTEPEEAA